MSLPLLIIEKLGVDGAFALGRQIFTAIHDAIKAGEYTPETPSQARADAVSAAVRLEEAEKEIEKALGKE